MPYNCKLFVLEIVTWSYHGLLRIIINYFKPYNYANKWLLLGINNYLKLVWKLFVLDKNTWYCITVQTDDWQMKVQFRKKCIGMGTLKILW